MDSPNPLAPIDRWKLKEIAQERQAIKGDLEQVGSEGHTVRLRHCLKKISELDRDTSRMGQIRRYIYCMSALVHHQRFGGLRPQQTLKISELAWTILKSQYITSKSKKLSFLYGDLHLVMSQIFRKSGRLFDAAWEQQLACRLSKHAPLKGPDFHAHAMAIRALRLGHGQFALKRFEFAEENAETPDLFVIARLGRIKTTRLIGELELADDLDKQLSQYSLTERQIREQKWETYCRKAQQSGDLQPMIKSVQRGGTHFSADYILEAFYWIHSVSPVKWMDRLPKIRSIARNKKLKPQRLNFFFDFASTLEKCHDLDIPFEFRLKYLGSALSKSDQLISIDKELLAWSCAARWLARGHAFSFATLALNEYRAICLRLTDGEKTDSLGTVQDLMNKPWYANTEDPEDTKLTAS